MKSVEQKRVREKETVSLMIEIYCHGRHGSKNGILCDDCRSLRAYAADRVEHCPHMATKTFCSACKTHCYKPEMREKIRTVMRYAGPRVLFYHPVMTVKHWFLGKRSATEGQASGSGK